MSLGSDWFVRSRDQAFEPQAPQMIGHLARGELAGRAGEELRHVGAQVFVSKASNQKTEHQQR